MPKPKPMSDVLVDAVALRFRALAEPARLRILQHLLAGERSVNELTEASGLSQANTSKHLATLHAAGFVARRKEGTTVYHAIADPVVHELCELMCARITAQARAGARAVSGR
jgi:ArsR family transcriptional regulator